jgi:HK97 family phage major capsid protein
MPNLIDQPRTRSGNPPRYSLLNAIRSACESGQQVPRTGFEAEVHQELLRLHGSHRKIRGFLAPLGILIGPEKRGLDLTQGAGGVATILDPEAIDALRSKLVVGRAGAMIGNFAYDQTPGQVALPRLSTASLASWVGDGVAPSQSNATLDQVLFTDHTVTTYTDITRKMLKSGTPAFEEVVIMDLTHGLAHETDRAALNGAGNSQVPLGLLQRPDIQSVKISSDAGNGGTIAWADLVNLELAVGKQDGDPAGSSLAWVTSPQLRAKLRKTARDTGASGIMCWDNDMIMERQAFSTTSIPSNITEGTASTLSAMIYGNFADLVVNLFTMIDVLINPFLQSTTGVVRVSAFLDVDINIRHAGSFAKMVGAAT